MDDIEELLIQIEELRARLVEVQDRKQSFSDPEVVKASEELEEVLIMYQELLRQQLRKNQS